MKRWQQILGYAPTLAANGPKAGLGAGEKMRKACVANIGVLYSGRGLLSSQREGGQAVIRTV